jgi:acetylornithine deacetylase/succinyl-diaminopimelate desuccinylase-like protein
MPSPLAAAVLLLLLLPGCAVPGGGPPRPYDPGRDGLEAVGLLRELIRFDTTNPPPADSGRAHADESALLRHVAATLAADGIGSRIHEAAPGRGNLVARLRGTGEAGPLLLMAHVDVVDVDRSRWTADPFGAELRDGYVWGRGALDDKDDAAIFIQVLRILRRARTPLKRDVILMLNADEESSGRFGAGWMVEHRWEEIACDAVISEGGSVRWRDGRVVHIGLQTAEKVYNDVRLHVRGESGHSSVPVPGNAIYRAASLLARAEGYRAPIRIHETVKASLRGQAEGPEAAPFAGLLRRTADGDLSAAEELAGVPRFAAQLRTTLVPTLVRGGIRENVLPPDVEINFNVRLLPGDRLEERLRDFLRHLGLAEVDWVEGGVEAVERWKRSRSAASAALFIVDRGVEAPGSPLDGEVYRALEAVSRRRAPGAQVLPRLSTGATDLRFFRARGIPSYGISPCPVGDAEEGTPHHHDERVSVDGVRWGVGYVLDLVTEIAGAGSSPAPAR